MSDVVDFLAFRAARRGVVGTSSALEAVALQDILRGLAELLELFSDLEDPDKLTLDDYDIEQLDLLASMSDTFLDYYELLGLNQVED